MPTGLEVREALANPPWKICLLLGTSTASSSSEGQITDTVRLQSTALPSTAYDGCYVRLTSEDSAAPNDYASNGSQSMVDYLDTTNGILNVSPNFITGAVSGVHRTGETYEVWYPGVNPDDVDRARDEALTRVCSSWTMQVISELTNGDMEDVIGTTWSNDSGGGTVVLQTLSFPYEYTRNSLLLTNGGANGYSASDSLYTQPNQRFYVFAPVSAQTGTAELIVQDITNGGPITLSGTTTTVAGRGWTAFEVIGTIPSGCYEIQVWLRGQESNAVIEYGPVNFHWNVQRRIALPDRITTDKHVGPIFVAPLHMRIGGTVYWGQGDVEEVIGIRVEQVSNNVMLSFDSPMVDMPYYFTERIFYDTLSTAYMADTDRVTGDAAPTNCPLDYVTAATARLLAEQYLVTGNDPEFWNGILQQAMREMERMEREFGPETKPRQERSRTIFVPQLAV